MINVKEGSLPRSMPLGRRLQPVFKYYMNHRRVIEVSSQSQFTEDEASSLKREASPNSVGLDMLRKLPHPSTTPVLSDKKNN